MMDNMLGGGSSGMSAAMTKLMQAKMMENLFGIKGSQRPIHAEAEMVGDDPNGSFGIVGMRLYSATMTSPVPRLELETNGKLLVHPDAIPALVKFFQRIEGEFTAKYGLALEEATKLEGAEIFAAGLGLETGGSIDG